VNVLVAVFAVNQPVSISLYSLTHWEPLDIIHVGGGIALLVFAAIHLKSNWNWVRINFLRNTKQ
jgi:hypothetical protein